MPFYPKRLRTTIVEADLEAVTALRDIADYRPHNPSHAADVAAAQALTLQQAREHEARMERALAAARSASQQAEWALHETMLGVKAEVIAQYGANSEQVRAIGLKKRSEYKRPSRRSAPPPQGIS
jgi:hypothetical protein